MTTCIGWHDPDGCPHYGGEYHGCYRHYGFHKIRRVLHYCSCGATQIERESGRMVGKEKAA